MRGLTVAQCTARCDAEAECSCVTMQPGRGLGAAVGACWMRSGCDHTKFEPGTGYDVYVKEGGGGGGGADVAKYVCLQCRGHADRHGTRHGTRHGLAKVAPPKQGAPTRTDTRLMARA